MDSDRMMRNMLQSMGMGMPFGGSPFDSFGPPNPHSHHPNSQQRVGNMMMDPFGALMPRSFMSPMMSMMMDPFQSMQQAMSMASNGNGGNGGFSYCSSSVTSYTTDEHGRPQVYQQSNEIKQGPDGLKETKSSVRDSKSGHQELAIGHHLRDKAHIKKKAKNMYTGDEEQAEDFVNLEEDEAESFERNWTQQARNLSSHNRLQYGDRAVHHGNSSRLALTNGADTSSSSCYPQPSRSYAGASSKYTTTLPNEPAPRKEKKKKKTKEDRYK